MSIVHETDRERAQAAVIEQLAAGRDALAKRVEALGAALDRIAKLDPTEDSDEGYNEWGEADCFNQAQKLARAALKENQT